MTHAGSVRELLRRSGNTVTLWQIVKEFCVQPIVTLVRQLATVDASFKGGTDPCDEPVGSYMRGLLLKSIPLLLDLGLKTSPGIANDFADKLAFGELTDGEFSQYAFHLFRTLQHETEGVICFKTDDTYTHILEGNEPLSNQVVDRFPKSVQEIKDGATCILYECGTACVFHSMRAVEVVLKAAWKTLGLDRPRLSDSWGKLLEPLDKQLLLDAKNRDPLWQANLEFFSEVVADIRAVKRSYRDNTMHVESTYTLHEARAIFNATKTLIAHAAKHLDQDGDVLPDFEADET